MKNKFWKRTAAFALALAFVAGATYTNTSTNDEPMFSFQENVSAEKTEVDGGYSLGWLAVDDVLERGDNIRAYTQDGNKMGAGYPCTIYLDGKKLVDLPYRRDENSTGFVYTWTAPVKCIVDVKQGDYATTKATVNSVENGIPLELRLVTSEDAKTLITPTLTVTDVVLGQSLEFPVEGNTGNGTVTYYYKTANSSWTTTAPTTIGTYYVYAKVAETETCYDGETPVSSFEISGYSVDFDANRHGTDPASVTVPPNEKITAPEPIEDAGIEWLFDGWYTEPTCENAFDFENTEITENMILYAKWTEAPYTITRKNEAESLFAINGRRASENDNITFSVRDGYIFEGTPIVMVGENSIALSEENGVYSFTMPNADVTISIPEGSVQKTPYTIGKSADNNIVSMTINGEEITSDTTVNVDDKILLTVREPATDSETGKVTEAVQKIKVIDNSTNSELTPEVKRISYNTYELTMPAKNVTVSAEFGDIAKYTVFYFGDAENGRLTSCGLSNESVLEEDVVLGDTTIRSMIVDAVDANEMQFQYQDTNGTWSNPRNITVIQDSSDIVSNATPIGGGMKVAIIKGETNMVGVSFVADASVTGGTLNYFTTSGNKITAPNAPVKDGYLFNGWESRGKNSVTYSAGDSVQAPTFSADGNNVLVLNAVWERKEKVTATFDSTGGSPVNSQTVDYGELFTEPDAPTKENYSFSRWVIAEKCGSFPQGAIFSFDKAVKEDLSLKASWTHMHSYSYYQMDSEIFKDKFTDAEREKYRSSAHIKLCDSCGIYYLEMHHYDEDRKCQCGYELPDDVEYVTVHNHTDHTTQLVPKGSMLTLIAPKTNDKGEEFVRWGYGIGAADDRSGTLSNNRSLAYTISKKEKAEEISVKAIYGDANITKPECYLVAKPANAYDDSSNSYKALQFYADYRLPDGWEATNFVLSVGDNDMLYYFTPDSINIGSIMKNSFLNMFGKKKLGGYYCFEKIDDGVSGLFKTVFTKIPVYYPREDNVMVKEGYTGYDLAEAMYEGKGITVKEMDLMKSSLNSLGKTGNITKNVIPIELGYGDSNKDENHWYYASGYLECIDNYGDTHTYVIDAIAATAVEAADGTSSSLISEDCHEIF